MQLPTEQEVLAAVEASPAFDRLRRFTFWVGDGRRLTGTGRLTRADAAELIPLLDTGDVLDPVIGQRRFRTSTTAELPGVSLVFDWALLLGLVRIVKGRLVPVKKNAALLRRPVDLWQEAFRSVPRLREPFLDVLYEDVRLYMTFQALPAGLLLVAYAATEPVPVIDLGALATEVGAGWGGQDGYDDAEEPTELARATQTGFLVDGLLRLFAELGVLEFVRDGGPPAAKRAVRLTPLGRWAVNTLLRDYGYHAPVAGEPAPEGVAELLPVVADCDEETAAKEFAAWLDRRGAAAGAAELARYIGAADDPCDRILAVDLLCRIERATAEPELRALLDDDRSRGFALLTLGTQGWGPGVISRDDVVAATADTLGFSLHTSGPDEVVRQLRKIGDPDEQAALLRDLGKVRRPIVAELLEALAGTHPDPGIAKAARKSLYKHNSPVG